MTYAFATTPADPMAVPLEDNPRLRDDYQEVFEKRESEDAFKACVRQLEEHSEWLNPDDIATRDLRVEALPTPMEMGEVMSRYKLDYAACEDTCGDNGTKLMVHQTWNGETYRTTCLRACGMNTLYESAKLNGSALGRMTPGNLAATLNYGLDVASGNSRILIRDGKISALHKAGYEIMPQHTLVDIVTNMADTRFGGSVFVEGSVSHDYTEGVWVMPGARGRLLKLYQKALGEHESALDIEDFWPGVQLCTSDTGYCAARLIPVFVKPNRTKIRFVDGVRVKHDRTDDEKSCVELFREEADGIWARFEASLEKVAELASMELQHPENAVISLCKRFGIPKGYGEEARSAVEEQRLYTGKPVTAHDVYCHMSEIVSAAKNRGASRSTINKLSDDVARVLNVDWYDHDVGGTISW